MVERSSPPPVEGVRPLGTRVDGSMHFWFCQAMPSGPFNEYDDEGGRVQYFAVKLPWLGIRAWERRVSDCPRLKGLIGAAR